MGYAVRARAVANALTILAHLERSDHDADDSGLAAAVTAVVAKNPSEQSEVRDHLLRALAQRKSNAAPVSPHIEPVPHGFAGNLRRWIGLALLTLVVVGLIAVIELEWRPFQGAPDSAAVTDLPVTAGSSWVSAGRRMPLIAMLLILTAIGLAAIGWSEAARRRRPSTAVPDPYADRIDLGAAPFTSWLYRKPEIQEVAHKLRDFRRVRQGELDAEATIERSIRNGGLFSPVHRKPPRSPVYAVLCQEESRHDHLARLLDNLCLALREEGVDLEQCYYRGGLFLSPGPSGTSIYPVVDRLKGLREATLLVFGDASALTRPLREEVDPAVRRHTAAWRRRVLLSTRAIETWGEREHALLKDGWAIATARLTGLAAVAEHLTDEHSEPSLLNARMKILPPGGAPAVGVRTFAEELALQSLMGRLRALREEAVSDQVNGELEDISQLAIAGDAGRAAQRLRILGTLGLIDAAGASISTASGTPPVLSPESNPAQLARLHELHEAVHSLSPAEVTEIAGAIRAYRALSNLPEYRIDHVSLAEFDRRLGSARTAPAADVALAAVAGAITLGTVASLFQHALRAPLWQPPPERAHERFVLSDGRRFFGRAQLRQFALQAHQIASKRALFCLGGERAGKSMSRLFLEDVAIDTCSFGVIALGAGRASIGETEERLMRAAAARTPERALIEIGTPGRVRDEWLRPRPDVTIIFVDDADRLSHAAQLSLARIVTGAATLTSPMRLVITGRDAETPFSQLAGDAVLRFIEVEDLGLGASVLDPEGAILDLWMRHHRRSGTS